jgi:hypothetical protein
VIHIHSKSRNYSESLSPKKYTKSLHPAQAVRQLIPTYPNPIAQSPNEKEKVAR